MAKFFVCSECKAGVVPYPCPKHGSLDHPKRTGHAVPAYLQHGERGSYSEPRFDQGLGCYVTSQRDRIQKAAALGAVPLQ